HEQGHHRRQVEPAEGQGPGTLGRPDRRRLRRRRGQWRVPRRQAPGEVRLGTRPRRARGTRVRADARLIPASTRKGPASPAPFPWLAGGPGAPIARARMEAISRDRPFRMSLRVLTGIKPTGVPHLGNYVGAIRPAVDASTTEGAESFFFLADYHALISTQDPLRVQRSTLEIAASWMACGLDPERVAFYRQSDVPETTELTWLLTCVAGKGLLNRAHAYKAAVDRNR